MAEENIIFMGTNAALQATDITDTESGDLLNTATITASIFDGDARYPVSILPFNSGGVAAIAEGDVIREAAGAPLATALVNKVVVTSGYWAAGNAAGFLEISGQDSVFAAGNLDIIDGQADIATIAGDSTGLAALVVGVGTAEVQTSTLGGLMTGGTFTMTYRGETTAAIAFDATTAEIKTALETLSTVEVGDITPEAAHEPDTELTCTWTFATDLGNTPMLSMDISQATMAVETVSWAETTPGGAGTKTKIPMNTNGIDPSGFVRIESTMAYDEQYDIESIEVGFITIDKIFVAETFKGTEVIYVGIPNGKDIAFTHEGGDADGYYDAVQPRDLKGVFEDSLYFLFEKIVFGGVTVLHRYQWPAGYYSKLKVS